LGREVVKRGEKKVKQRSGARWRNWSQARKNGEVMKAKKWTRREKRLWGPRAEMSKSSEKKKKKKVGEEIGMERKRCKKNRARPGTIVGR